MIVAHLDCLSRSTLDVLNDLGEIKAGAKFKLLKTRPAPDTTTPMGNLVTTMMAGLAQCNREMILKRCEGDRKLAKVRVADHPS